MPIKAVLGNSSISVNDFLGLQVGDIIPVSYTHLDVYKRQNMHRDV